MITLDEAIISRLDGDADVNAMADGRTFTGERPQGSALPAVTVLLVSQQRTDHLAGADDMILSRVQFDCWAERPDDALRLAGAVRAALQPTAEVNGLLFWRGSQEGLRTFREEDGTDRVSLELLLRHTDDIID